MFNYALRFIRKHHRIVHASMAVALFISYFHLEEKPDDAELPLIRIIVVGRDEDDIFLQF